MVGLLKAFIALACFLIHQIYQSAICDRLAYLLPANVFSPFFQIDWCICIPDPLSSGTGFGIKLATFSVSFNIECTIYLCFCTSSAARSASLNLVPISF